jgi:hypothetical protein
MKNADPRARDFEGGAGGKDARQKGEQLRVRLGAMRYLFYQ